MLTRSTARYFAKEAYSLSVRNGLVMIDAKNGTLAVERLNGAYRITEKATGESHTIKIAKSWLY